MLLLVADPRSAYSVKEMAARNPGDPVWSVLASLFTHVPWTGVSFWDLVMPSFVFLIGASVPFSYAARAGQGQNHFAIVEHAVLRAIAFSLLGVMLAVRPDTHLDEAWPLLLVLGLSLPFPEILGSRLPGKKERNKHLIRTAWWCALLAAAFGHVFLIVHDPGVHESAGLLVQVGLAFVPAFLLVNRSLAVQAAAAAAILVLNWLLFLLYPLPPAGLDLATVAVPPDDERFTGLFAHWNKNTNLASAFDVWLFNQFSRSAPFELHAHGYQTLNFVPMISTIIFGMMAGRLIRDEADRIKVRNRLAGSGLALVLAGLAAALTVCPLVKSIWTPSWALFSAGCAMSVLAVLFHLFDLRGPRRWALPLIVVGTNSLLVYVLSYYRWRILQPWQLGLGPDFFSGYWGPILESSCVALTLWLLAFTLFRLRIFVRI